MKKWQADGHVTAQCRTRLTIRYRDAVQRARAGMPAGESAEYCDDCGEPIPEKRRAALPGTRTCVACQAARDATRKAAGIKTGAGSKGQPATITRFAGLTPARMAGARLSSLPCTAERRRIHGRRYAAQAVAVADRSAAAISRRDVHGFATETQKRRQWRRPCACRWPRHHARPLLDESAVPPAAGQWRCPAQRRG